MAFVILVAIAWSGWGTSAPAAKITVMPWKGDPNPAHALVLVEGELKPDDDKLFRSRVGPLTKAVIGFSSDGGSLLAGIAIGKVIRLKSFPTVVVSGTRCASACALAWLGGAPRFMENNAFVGFHAAYVRKDGKATETGVGNALVGSYLTELGLPESAVVYITVRAPDEMNWLSMQDAERFGIDVQMFKITARGAAEAFPKQPTAPAKQPAVQAAPAQPTAPPPSQPGKISKSSPGAAPEAPPKQPAPQAAPAGPAASPPGQPGPTLPKEIESNYASEASGRARMLTCRDQYNANKDNGGNGGLSWVQEGGGYYSVCNTHLKAMGF